jgi:putative FmdB family regulatory protein
MPLYEYECESCHHRFERIQKFSDAPIETCPKCGSKVHKLLSSPAIQFKGSGWYITDYAKKSSTDSGKGSGASGSTKTDGSATSDSDTSSSKTKSDSTESKPATKTDSK